jgi:ABC-type branched-subunit amino acid transport system substrate-binding protein
MKGMMKSIFCIVFAFAVSTLCAQDIVIGQFASLTGSEATFGINSSNGTELAKEEINNSGGVLGRKIKIVTEDDQSKPGQPSAAVKKLIAWKRRQSVSKPKSQWFRPARLIHA